MQPQAQIPSPPKAGTRAQSKELTIILERQRLFKEAALKAKQEGLIFFEKKFFLTNNNRFKLKKATLV